MDNRGQPDEVMPTRSEARMDDLGQVISRRVIYFCTHVYPIISVTPL